jgi:hypothetical protein
MGRNDDAQNAILVSGLRPVEIKTPRHFEDGFESARAHFSRQVVCLARIRVGPLATQGDVSFCPER